MKKFLLRHRILIVLFAVFISFAFGIKSKEDKPDKVYLFAYSTLKNNGKNGLHFAWSTDQKNWFGVGPEHSFLKSDYFLTKACGKTRSVVRMELKS